MLWGGAIISHITLLLIANTSHSAEKASLTLVKTLVELDKLLDNLYSL